jgi:hypothetical protein
MDSGMTPELRAELELMRRRSLLRQIGALEDVLVALERARHSSTYLRRHKLRSKIERLYVQLNQPMLITM